MILPAGYRANGIFDTAETYSTVYKGDWISYSPINQKYRVSQLLEPNSEGKEYGTDIRIQEPVVGDCPVTLAGYDKPLSLPQNMKVLSMQWLGPDNEPMRKFDKFELGKYYTLDLSIGFEGGEEKGYVFPKNWKEFKVNGKSVNAWMEYKRQPKKEKRKRNDQQGINQRYFYGFISITVYCGFLCYIMYILYR